MTYVRDTGSGQNGFERNYSRGVFARFIGMIGALMGDVFDFHWKLLHREVWNRSAQISHDPDEFLPYIPGGAPMGDFPFFGVNMQLRQLELYFQGSGPIEFERPVGHVIKLPPPPEAANGLRGAVYIARVSLREQTRNVAGFFIGLVGDDRTETGPVIGALIAANTTTNPGDLFVGGFAAPDGWEEPKDNFTAQATCCARDVWLRLLVIEGEPGVGTFSVTLAISWDGINFFAPDNGSNPEIIDFLPTGMACGLMETAGDSFGAGRDIWAVGDVDMYPIPDAPTALGMLPHAGARSTR